MRKTETLKVDGLNIEVSNLDKVMFPQSGCTKGEIIKYYIQVHEIILPHLKNRPITMIRMPNGTGGQIFYEKQAPSYTPKWVSTAAVKSKTHGAIDYILINDLKSLVWAVNLANLEMHCFLAHVPKIASPDSVVFDLDPGPGKGVLDCAELALEMRDIFLRLKLESYVKTSGSKGMQLYIPLNSAASYDETALFAKNVAEYLETQKPDLVVSKMSKSLRDEKILIDWSQNSVSKTTVAVYSLRAKKEEPYISLPFSWIEIKKLLKKGNADDFYYEPDEAIKRLKKVGDIFSPLLKQKQRLPEGFRGAPPSTLKKREKEVSLTEYKKKRDFSKTAEPGPKVKKSSKQNLFVIQKHDASHLHYDFRLEMNGVLKSWAVPKGPPFESGDRRLAMQVEDHPVDYADFEGIIPAGHYGGGTVMVWDTGKFIVESGDPLGELERGKIDVVLDGHKLKGKWVMVQDKRELKRWLMLKDKEAKIVGKKSDIERSCLTHRTMNQIASAKDAVWNSNKSQKSKSTKT